MDLWAVARIDVIGVGHAPFGWVLLRTGATGAPISAKSIYSSGPHNPGRLEWGGALQQGPAAQMTDPMSPPQYAPAPGFHIHHQGQLRTKEGSRERW